MKTLTLRGLMSSAIALALVALPNAAHADIPLDPPSCSPSAPIVPLASALHSARRVEEGLAWDVRYVIDLEASTDFRGGMIPLATPLPSGETLHASRGATAIVESGRIVGLCVGREALVDPWSPHTLPGRTLAVSFVQPGAVVPGRALPFGAPTFAGSAVQIVLPALTPDTRLELRSDVFERHVGYVAPRAIGRDAREEALRLTDTKEGLRVSPIYLRGDDVHAAHAAGTLEAYVLGPRAHTRQSAFGVGVLFAGIVGALVLAARKLRQSATVERADALLAEELDSLTPSDPKEPR